MLPKLFYRQLDNDLPIPAACAKNYNNMCPKCENIKIMRIRRIGDAYKAQNQIEDYYDHGIAKNPRNVR